jgi:plasmid stabilization system protein ParE
VATNEPRWHPGAIADVTEAREWYAVRSPLAARGFLLALNAAVTAVTEGPGRWPKGRFDSRRYVFPRRYPYTLVYRLGQPLLIIAVAHHKRRPDYWKSR